MNFLFDIKNAFLPELIIIGFIIINIVLSLFFNKKFYKTSSWIAILGVLMSLASIIFVQAEPIYHAFGGAFVCNVYTVFFKAMILVSTFFVIFLSNKMVQRKRAKAFEYFAIMFCAVLGAMSLVSANDFLTMFISLETLGISCYLLSALLKNYKSKEAGLKYLIVGSVASALFLFGASYLYGSTKVLNFDLLYEFLNNNQPGGMFVMGFIFVISGVLFKLGTAPFSNWVPDIYEGSSYPVATFLSLVPKIAAIGVLARIFTLTLDFAPILKIILAIFAIVSIIFGTYGALRQVNFKRFMGYSSIVHNGFLLLGLSVLNAYSLSAIIYYLICYIFMNLALWAGLTLFNQSTGKDNIEDYTGLAYNHPFYTTAMIFSLMALAGLPPTSGFLAKLYIFSAVARSGFLFISFLLIALIFTVIGLCFYIKPIRVMFEKTAETLILDNKFVFAKITLYFCTTITVILCVLSANIISICELIAYSL